MLIGCDIETESITDNPKDAIHPRKNRITLVSFYRDEVKHVFTWGEPGIVAYFSNPEFDFVFHNFMFDVATLKAHGVEIKGNVHCSMIASYHYDENIKHSLKALAPLVGEEKLETEDMAHDKEYCLNDAKISYKLFKFFEPILRKDELWEAYKLDIEHGKVLLKMNQGIDFNKLIEIKTNINKRLEEYSEQLKEFKDINWNSPEQLSNYFYYELGMAPQTYDLKKSEQKILDLKVKLNQSVNGREEEIKERGKELSPGRAKYWETRISKLKFKIAHPQLPTGSKFHLPKFARNGCEQAKVLIEHRKFRKLLEYAETIEKYVDRKTWRVYPRYNGVRLGDTAQNDFGTTTNRIAVDSPNVQQIPALSKLEGYPNPEELHLRLAFKEPDSKVIVADYSNIEYRIAAHFARDKELIDYFKNGGDMHQFVADKLGIERKQAKTINFLMLYGGGAFNLSIQLNIPYEEAAYLIKQWKESVPLIQRDIEKTVAWGKARGYVNNIIGGKRRLPNLQIVGQGKEIDKKRQGAARQAYSFRIQGSAAVVIKIAAIKVNQAGYWVTNEVHDELTVRKYSGDIEESDRLKVKEIMEGVLKAHLSIPIDVDAKIVNSWGEAK